MSASPIEETIPPLTKPFSWSELWQTIVVLFKLRIVFLLLMAAGGGAFLGARGWPGWYNLLLVILTGGTAAAGASAINQYYERYSDQTMHRTQTRPLANGEIRHPHLVLAIALGLIIFPSLAVWFSHPALAFFNWLGAFIYVVIYTIWLKPRTLVNIVIGGAAGSAAVLSGAAVVGAWQDAAVLILALLLFMWTPSHFWSLAIMYREDYARSDTPMLPTRTTPHQAAWWVMAHTVPTAFAALALAVVPELGWWYVVPVALATAELMRRNILLIRQPDRPHALGLFLLSNIYLMVVLVAIAFATVVNQL
jgi:heme o synthase